MSVPSTTAWVQETISTIPQTVVVPFVFASAGDLLVLDSKTSPPTILALNSDYTVAGGGGAEGTIVVVGGGTNGVKVGDVITVSRAVPLTQTLSLLNGGPFTPTLMRQALDKLTEICQQLNLVGANSLQFQGDEQISGVLALAQRKNAFLAFNPAGVPWFPTTASIVASVANPIVAISINALRAILVAGVTANQTCSVLGYYAQGDGGGGVFYWAPTSALVDDGGTIITPTGVVGNGRWLRLISGAINVRWFGAKGDDAADDRAAIQLAIDYCLNLPIKEVYIPAGTYQISASIVVDNQGVNVSGEGCAGTIIKLFGTGSGPLADGMGVLKIATAPSNLLLTRISDLTLTATTKNNTYGILADVQTVKFSFHRIVCKNCHVGFWANGMQFSSVYGMTLDSCDVGLRLAADTVVPASGGNNNLFVDLEVKNCFVGMVIYNDGIYPMGCNAFYNPIIFYNSVCGVYLATGFNNTFYDATPEANATGAATYSFEGKTIRRSLWHIVDAQIVLRDYIHVSNETNAIVLRSAAVMTIDGGTTAVVSTDVDASSQIIFLGNVRLAGQVDNVVETGAMSASGGQQAIVGAPSSIEGVFENEIPNDPSAPYANAVNAGISYDFAMVDTFGLVAAIQFDAVIGGPSHAVAIKLRGSDFVAGEQFYCSMMVKANVDCELTCNFAESVATARPKLTAGVWTKITVAGTATATRGPFLSIYTNDDSGPLLYVARMFLKTCASRYELTSCFRWNPFNANKQPTSELADVVTDVDWTLALLTSPKTLIYINALTANRTITLPVYGLAVRGALRGARYRIVRAASATGAHNLAIGAVVTLTTAGTWADIEYTSGWVCTATGAL